LQLSTRHPALELAAKVAEQITIALNAPADPKPQIRIAKWV
jgi:propanediol dehydratase large subunit